MIELEAIMKLDKVVVFEYCATHTAFSGPGYLLLRWNNNKKKETEIYLQH